MSNTLVKWPGGKAREIRYIEHLIPPFDRYIEPFFGGGAMFFHLRPRNAVLNDISRDLMSFYTLVKEKNREFERYLGAYCQLFESLLIACDQHSQEIWDAYAQVRRDPDRRGCWPLLSDIVDALMGEIDARTMQDVILDAAAYQRRLYSVALDKMRRTIHNDERVPYSPEDLMENLITGFASGTYLYLRDVGNDIALDRNTAVGREYRAANFYFIREYCYGSMFRYNRRGEFNIPYGGMSYNRKDFRGKLENIFSTRTAELFEGADLFCEDFEDFLATLELRETDFMFLDPPYDTDFSDYEGKRFTQEDHRRLARILRGTRAQFILIIKNTDFISSLYKGDFHIFDFDKTYTYNVRSRNNRQAKHLIVTNMAV